MVDIVEELRKEGVKLTPVRPRKLSADEMKRHEKVQKAVRTFLKEMEKISQSTGRSVARFQGRAVVRCSHRKLFSKNFQKE